MSQSVFTNGHLTGTGDDSPWDITNAAGSESNSNRKRLLEVAFVLDLKGAHRNWIGSDRQRCSSSIGSV